MVEPDYHNHDPQDDEDYLLDSERECQKIDMGYYDRDYCIDVEDDGLD